MKTFLKSKSFLWISYAFIILLSMTIQSVPHLFEILGAKPLLLLIIPITAAIYKGEVVGAVCGVSCGLLWDMALTSPFGSYGFLFMVFGVVVGLMSRFLIQRTWFNNLFLVFAGVLIIQTIDFFFNYVIFGYEGVGIVFLTHYIPCIIYTCVVSPLFYLLIGHLHKLNS